MMYSCQVLADLLATGSAAGLLGTYYVYGGTKWTIINTLIGMLPGPILGFLREENGFDGMIMTDWNSYDTMDVRDAVEAGNCWMTPGSMDDTYVQPIVDGVKTGRTRLERLRENVAYILKTMIRFA